MAAPVISAGATLDGITTLVWGTGGALALPAAPAGYGGVGGEGAYIVESIDESEKAEQIYGENGTGIEVWRMTLKHGLRWNITVTDDTTMAPPKVGQTVSILDYLLAPANSAAGGGGGKTTYYTAKVLSNDYRAARKSAGQRVLQVENLSLVDAQP